MRRSERKIVGKTVAADRARWRRRNAPRPRFSAPVIRSVAARLNRYCGTSGRAATARRKNSFALFVQAQQAEDRAQRVERFGGVADDFRSGFGGLEGAARLAGNKQAFCAQNERNRILRHQCDRAIGADDGGIGAAPLQRGFGQKRPGVSIVRCARHQLRTNPLRRRHISVGEGASRLGHGCCANSRLGDGWASGRSSTR